MTDLGDRHPTDRDEPAPASGEWDGDQSWWSEELHIPYVPPRPVDHDDDEQDRWDDGPVVPGKEEFRYRAAPAGSSRRDRREWRQAEGMRIADLLATVQHPRKAGIRVSAPRGLGRKGRKAFYATRAENVQDRRRRAAGNLSEREVGILALVIIVAVAVLVRVVFFGETTPPAPSTGQAATMPAAPTISSSPSTPAATLAPGGPVTVDPAAVAAATAWFTVTCPLPPSGWAPVRPLMTPAAWSAVNTTPPVVTATWSCTNLDVRPAPDQQTAPPDILQRGGVIIRMDADRTITTGTTPTVTENARTVRVVVPADGHWLIDREPAN